MRSENAALVPDAGSVHEFLMSAAPRLRLQVAHTLIVFGQLFYQNHAPGPDLHVAAVVRVGEASGGTSVDLQDERVLLARLVIDRQHQKALDLPSVGSLPPDGARLGRG